MRLAEYVTSGSVTAGKLLVRNRKAFTTAMATFPDGEVLVTIERARATRSLEQNAWYFGVILKVLSEHTGYGVDELHEYCKQRFNPKRLALVDAHGEIVDSQAIGQSTTKLNKVTFGEYCEQIRQWAASELGCAIPDPDPNWKESAA